jgi:hypothetical protein
LDKQPETGTHILKSLFKENSYGFFPLTHIHIHTHFSFTYTHTLSSHTYTHTHWKQETRAKNQEARVCAMQVTFEADVLPLPVAVQPQHEVVTPAGLLLEVLAHMGLANKAG